MSTAAALSAAAVPLAATPLDVIRRWHDEEHVAGFELCAEMPCVGIRHVTVDVSLDLVVRVVKALDEVGAGLYGGLSRSEQRKAALTLEEVSSELFRAIV